MCTSRRTDVGLPKNNGTELDVIPSGGVFFVAAKPSKLLSRKNIALELNSMSQAEVERATSTRVHAGFGIPGPAAGDTLRQETRWTEMNHQRASEFPRAR